MLIDSHCHLNFPDFTEDFQDILQNARDNNISHLQTICTRISEFQDILTIARSHEFIYCSIGVHPSNVHLESLVSAEELISLANDPKVIGFGETGLDYYHSLEYVEFQKRSFIEHMKASQFSGLPAIIHSRNADEDTYYMIKDMLGQSYFVPLIHCFTGGIEFARKLLDLGCYISLSGIVTFKNAKALHEVARFLPLDRLLIETDSPYLAPMPHRGKRNEPAYVRLVAEFIANLRGVDISVIEEETTRNFLKIFNKVKKI